VKNSRTPLIAVRARLALGTGWGEGWRGATGSRIRGLRSMSPGNL
jgi:hypothetical protein